MKISRHCAVLFMIMSCVFSSLNATPYPTQILLLPTDEGAGPLTWNAPLLGLRVDCLRYVIHEQQRIECLKLNSAKFGYSYLSPDKRHGLRLSFNPRSSWNANLKRTPFNDPSSEEREFAVDDFNFAWGFDSGLVLALEKYSGPKLVPDTSGLSFGGLFFERGWDQLAMSLGTPLALGMDSQILFVFGNGEGKALSINDGARFMGVETRTKLFPSLIAHFGFSLNNNSAVGKAYENYLHDLKQQCGFEKTHGDRGYSTRRLGLGLIWDGSQAWARGLRTGLGWQLNTRKDLDENHDAYASVKELSNCKYLDESDFFIEDPDHIKAFTQNSKVYLLNMSYRILDAFFVGLDYEIKTMTLDDNGFSICQRFDGHQCMELGSPKNTLVRDATTLGFGFNSFDGMGLSFEYHMSNYFEDYEKFYFPSDSGVNKQRRLFNIRLSYANL